MIFQTKKSLLYPFIGLLLLWTVVGCNQSSPTSAPLKETRFLMGTVITITLYDQQDPLILSKAFERIAAIEDALSLNLEDSTLSEVNQKAGKDAVQVTEDMLKVVTRSLYYSYLTSGAFDISIGPLVDLWRIGFPDAKRPTDAELVAVLPLIDYTKIHINPDAQTIALMEEGMMLDVGGIAKGYATDEVVALLRDHGVNHALIDLGGNIYTLGPKPDGTDWKVGIQDPFNPRGTIIGYIPLTDQSIVTSGIYERYLEVDGQQYHHLLDPHTGYPFDNAIAGVTILSTDSIDGDALSTAVFSQGIHDGLAFVNHLPGIEAIFVSKDYKVYLSDGIKETFVLDHPSFTLMP